MEIKKEIIMKYYDSNSLSIRDTEDKETTAHYNEDVLSIRNIFFLIILPLMALTVLLQIIWFNIILHTALCSIIITLSFSMMICDYVQKDIKKMSMPVAFMTFWLTNIIINLVKYFII